MFCSLRKTVGQGWIVEGEQDGFQLYEGPAQSFLLSLVRRIRYTEEVRNGGVVATTR